MLSGLRQTIIGCVLGSSLLAAAGAADPVPDVRVLIDVSGSMKKNDPDNLRAPALRLLVDLLPRDASAGVWTFGHRVSQTVAVGPADPAWRRRALAAAAQLHSRDLHTDIEQALRAAARDWTAPDPGRRRIVLLLTDGLVDLGEDPQRNAASRERVLTEVLARLRDLGVTLYTVGLSRASDGDLLERLAVGTGGWHESVERAEQLDRVFLRLLTQGTRPDSVPLKANRFAVDDTVEDMTVVVFRLPGAEPTALEDPQGVVLTAARHPGVVRWRSEPGHDLITVERPAPGTWQIRAAEDPDNRVLVMTNLRLEVEPLPARLVRDDTLSVQARLLQASAQVEQAGFLSLVRFDLEDRGPGQEPRVLGLADDGLGPDRAAGDGRYAAALGPGLAAGVHELVVVARGGSFEREFRHRVQVHDSPVVTELVAAGPGPAGPYRLSLRADPTLLHLDSLQVRAAPSGAAAPVLETARVEQDLWVTEVPAHLHGRELELEVRALEPTGRTFELRRRFSLPHAETDGTAPAAAAGPPAAPAAAPPGVASGLEAPAWMTVATYVVALNLLVAVLGVGGYRLWRRRTRGADEAVIRLPAESPVPGPAPAPVDGAGPGGARATVAAPPAGATAAEAAAAAVAPASEPSPARPGSRAGRAPAATAPPGDEASDPAAPARVPPVTPGAAPRDVAGSGSTPTPTPDPAGHGVAFEIPVDPEVGAEAPAS